MENANEQAVLEKIIDEIRLELTGYVLETEIDDATLTKVIYKALRELQRYWDETCCITIPFATCIDYGTSPDFKEHVSSIVKIYRTTGVGEAEGSGMNDVFYAQQWMLFSNGGTMLNLNDYILNYASWMTLSSIRNTMATDLAFKDDKHAGKLYINSSMTRPSDITIEYIPKLTKASDIQSDYWFDILVRMCVDLTKIVLGRIRTRFTQTNALWAQDGDKLLEEGNSDLKELRETLRINSQLIYPID